MLISDIAQRLYELITLLGTTDAIGAEQAYTIAKFFCDFGDTNSAITEAAKPAGGMASTENTILYNSTAG